jgi:tetratricopeptide (TPR) repeat protein
MPSKKIAALAASVFAFAAAGALAHDEASATKEKLGKVQFANSCSPAVQQRFQRAVAMLHSFWYSAAEAAFEDVASDDHTCGIAAWGFASILMSNPLAGAGASAKDAPRAQAAIEKGRAMGAKTQRERDYLEAVAAYYENFAGRTERERQLSRAKAYEALAAKYPKDDEAQIFYALYLAGTQQQSDQSYASYLKAAGILEKQFRKHPGHPGVAHYLIHSYDAPPIAQKGVRAARLYAGLAPDAPHALHMPSHIFTRVGAWSASAATNRRSANVAEKSGEPDEATHAMDYMTYAYLQLARDGEARKVLEESSRVSGTNPARFVAPYALAAMPARIALERGAWREAAQLQPQPSRYPFTEAITYSARAIGAARSGDAEAAARELAEIEKRAEALKAAKNIYWSTEVDVMRLSAAAWLAYAQGKGEEALTLMRQAADMEDHNEKHIVTPGRVLPARELLGDMLMELKRPSDALQEYEQSQRREPDRLRGLYGAAKAAEAVGDKAKATRYFRRMAQIARGGDGERSELKEMKQYLSSK